MLERAGLAIVAAIVAADLAGALIPALRRGFPDGWPAMPAESAVAAFLSALSLNLSEARQPEWMHRLSLVLAASVTLLASVLLVAFAFHLSSGFPVSLPGAHGPGSPFPGGASFPGGMPAQTASAFVFLGFAMLLIRARKRLPVLVADLATCGLVLLVLISVSEHVMDALRFSGASTSAATSSFTMLCLLLLTLVAFLRRTESGAFSILLRHGIGGRIARLLFPILLVLPYLREVARIQLVDSGRIPVSRAMAILASVGVVFAFALVLFLAWNINSMEMKIHGLTLRDELTGLYNLRGFQLFAEQALRLAYRSSRPFSVLYIDLDNLKQVNDSLGHPAGSAFLAETGELLKEVFRQTDVLGRIGGDEFAVAGQFDHLAISVATRRLRESCARRNAETQRRFPLGFSVGHATTENARQESLEELLNRADHAMYEDKRRRKMPAGQGVNPA
jgi:diguanylate cyclase (GGDEF)-like protein